MARAVRFDDYGAVDVLEVRNVDAPEPGPGQVRIEVRAAGINPGEDKIRSGALREQWPSTFPSGQGSDFAGVVTELGEGVQRVAVGDEVIGWTDERGSHAELVVAPAEHLTPKPPGVSWEVAGALFVAGSSAYAAVRAVDAGPGDNVVVSAAAGGVGSITVQLARRAGARVIGLASEANHPWLSRHGIVPVAYGEGVAERIREAAPGGVDALIDLAATDTSRSDCSSGWRRTGLTRSLTSPPCRSTASRPRAQRPRRAPRCWPSWPAWSRPASSRSRSPGPTPWTRSAMPTPICGRATPGARSSSCPEH